MYDIRRVRSISIEIDIKVRMISFWANLLTGKDSKLSCLAYKLLLSLTDTVNFKSDWLESIKNIFNECGMPYIWRNQNFMSSTWLKLTIKLVSKININRLGMLMFKTVQ